MSPVSRPISRSRLTSPLVLLAVAFLIVVPVIEGIAPPHTHAGGDPALYNADCALALVARLPGTAPVPDALPIDCRLTVTAPVVVPSGILPEPPLFRHADPRAPPR